MAEPRSLKRQPRSSLNATTLTHADQDADPFVGGAMLPSVKGRVFQSIYPIRPTGSRRSIKTRVACIISAELNVRSIRFAPHCYRLTEVIPGSFRSGSDAPVSA
jgi:hypothetical protein